MLATEVRAAAQRCESLRDNLWFLLDSKVATAIAIDDRTEAQRPAWLAAAAAVTTGAGDRWTAAEIVRQQVKPYVDNDIRNDWLTAMRSSLAGVVASYDMVVDRMAAAPVVYFELPGDLGPGWQPMRASPAERAARWPRRLRPPLPCPCRSARAAATPSGGSRAGSQPNTPGTGCRIGDGAW